MALNQRPFWTNDVSILTVEVVPGAKSAKITSLDLTQKRGAWLYVCLGRLDGDSITGEPISITVRDTNSDESRNHPNSNLDRVGNGVTADGDTTIDVTVAVGDRVVPVADTTNFAIGDLIFIGSTAGARGEFAKVVAIDAGVSLTVDMDIVNEHTSGQADVVINQADVFHRFWIGGGSLMVIEANYLSASGGPDMWVDIFAQTYDGDGTP